MQVYRILDSYKIQHVRIKKSLYMLLFLKFDYRLIFYCNRYTWTFFLKP